ncbi:hypothetical protein [Rhizobium beringeri]|uniref:hypothetical protein n=1 Tax=Rhizobium beringeri TaxID=3019934 RepID=UPI002E12F442|nr:hypothetical protein U8P75_26435 [Rhizobium beringeri]WSH82952.1 hypothetical protein U8P69_24575 [Rhizobium beringeri]
MINVSLEATRLVLLIPQALFPVDQMATIGRRRNILNLLLPTVAGAGLEDVWVGGAVHPFRCLSKLEVSDWSLRGISDNNHDALVSAARPAGQQDKLPFIRAGLVQDAIKHGDFAAAAIRVSHAQAKEETAYAASSSSSSGCKECR